MSRLPDEWHDLQHTLWSKAAGCSVYLNSDGMKLQSILFQAAAKIAELDDDRGGKD